MTERDTCGGCAANGCAMHVHRLLKGLGWNIYVMRPSRSGTAWDLPGRAGPDEGERKAMSEPARRAAPAPPADHPESPANLASPSHAAWCDYRTAATTEIQAARLAVEEMAARPGSDRPVKLAESILGAMEALRGLGERRMLDEAILAFAEQAAYEQGVADTKAGLRRCLRPVPGPR